MMTEDERCCGTGTCLINAEGVCWCGQRWDGEKMCFAEKPHPVEIPQDDAKPQLSPNA
ncbi:MAG: hypothetical protein H7197_10765 [Vitreoscilla sp.]|nr:hypothetical protein [Polaromonas sp.]